jgi:hypothetical protein
MVHRDGSALVTAGTEDDAQLSDSDGDLPRPFEIQSYLKLLQFPETPPTGKDIPSGKRDISIPVVDAILVPTFRSAEQISSAVELASRARCELLTLHTDGFPPGLSGVLAGLREGTATPLALLSEPRDYHLLDLGADLPQSFVAPAALDISRKRNLGLLIGRMRGWTRMLLLDDDIRRLSIEKLTAAAALLDDYPVVGLRVKKYPDASVVGHARRLTGRRQEPFVSGGALLVDPQRLNGFFPAIYHEDWLCIINHLRARQVAIGGTVGQMPYPPFAFPQRARNEEFGDILASGLLWLVHERKSTPAAATASDADYWRAVTKQRFWAQILQQRARLLREVAERLTTQYPDDLPADQSPEVARQSLDIARQRCAELTPDEFVLVTNKWMSNLEVWRERLSRLPRVDSVEKALAELGIPDIVLPYPAGPGRVPADTVRRRPVKLIAMGSAAVIVSGLAGAAPSVLKTFRHRAGKSSLSLGHGRGSRLGLLVGGGGAGGGPERPLAGGDQAEHQDGAAAGSQQQPGGVTGRHELGPEGAVQAGGQDRAGDGHAERRADLAAGGSDT